MRGGDLLERRRLHPLPHRDLRLVGRSKPVHRLPRRHLPVHHGRERLHAMRRQHGLPGGLGRLLRGQHLLPRGRRDQLHGVPAELVGGDGGEQVHGQHGVL